MSETGITGLLLIIANIIYSYKGFSNAAFFSANKLEIQPVLSGKEYKRLITSGFLHVNWTHLFFNMFSLYMFSASVASYLGVIRFLIVYFTSLLGGSLLSLLLHRHHADYSAVGASGAVCGIIFASLALFPGMNIGFFFLPLAIPGWIFGLLYVLYSLYGIRSRKDNIGHEAHLGGALVGMFTVLLMEPGALVRNYFTILVITVPILIFIYIIIRRPQTLLIDNQYYRSHQRFYNIDHKYNAARADRQREIDRILDKIGKSGMDSLSKEEQELLQAYAEEKE